MRALEEQARNDLRLFLKRFLREGNSKSLLEDAQVIEGKYLQASTLLSEETFNMLGILTDIYAKTGRKVSKEQVQKIIEKLN